VLRAANKPFEASAGQLIALAVTAVSLAVLLPTLGLIGAGIASGLAYAVSLVALARRASRALELSRRKLLVPDWRDVDPRLLLAYGRGLRRGAV
jgi:O-antigen/teichoic acid export membrane protein